MIRLPRLFRKGATPPAAGDDDWTPGDLAECLYSGPWYLGGIERYTGTAPVAGEVRAVQSVSIDRLPATGERTTFLHFARYGARHRFHSAAFRKITPRADEATRCEAEFLPLVGGRPLPAKEKA